MAAGQQGTITRTRSGGSDAIRTMPAPAPAPLPASSPAPLDAPVTTIKGVGERLAETLGKIGLFTVGDLLAHYPRRYEDRSRFVPIAETRDGEAATLAGKVTLVENRPTKNRLVLTKVTLDDSSGALASLTWFNQWRMKQTWEKMLGKRVVAYGIVKRFGRSVEIMQPEWEALDEGGEDGSLAVGRIVPIYPATEGLGQGRLRKILFGAVERFADRVPDVLPDGLRAARSLIPAPDAVRAIHFPETVEAIEQARRRLVYEELFALQLLLAGRKAASNETPGIAFADTAAPVAELADALPFALTGAQGRVIEEITADMTVPTAMNRLLQGDVGSGKTAVALAALLVAVRNGYQGAFMAPTEILAEQHFQCVRGILEKLGVRVDLLTGSRSPKEKEAARARVASGETQIAVGTHALIQEGVRFARLGLVVVDEQHRFGVLQRQALAGKGDQPDVLVMTATPIPRTLTLTVYGDLDVSVLDELPPGRKPIRTHWKTGKDKPSVYEGVRKLIQSDRQAYVVCPLIEESEKVQARAAGELAAHLAQHVFPEFVVGLLHGQMKTEEKENVMRGFKAGEIHVLVSTTVIEVGVDVPNAAVMVIEDADRFGLAQLHQLRGRVGRGAHASFCILVADPKTPDGEARLHALCDTNDGFKIAEEDLRLRGPGEFYGVRQSGLSTLRIADVLRDGDILRAARDDAFALLARDPKLARPEHRALRDALAAQQQRARTLAPAA